MTWFISPYLPAEQVAGHLRYGDGASALAPIRTAWGHLNAQDPGPPWEQEGLDGIPGGVGTRNGNGTDLAHVWSSVVPTRSGQALRPTPA
jgi:hypothetical protein